MKPGDPSNPVRVAVVGSGPSAFYAAEALLRQKDISVKIDMFDRLPTPYGLVRGGVAPDHQKIKGVVAVYERIAGDGAFRFFGNVKLGRDISADELRRDYDQVVYAVGNESDRRLGIPGEDLAGSYSATAFVGWYNAHPDYKDLEFDLSVESAAVIGIGNVAMDVTRILAQDPEKLAGTDIADYALEALRQSRIKTVYLLGRRGPAQAAYSPAEIAEIGELESADLELRPDELILDETSKAECSDPTVKKNVDYVLEAVKRPVGAKGRKISLRFCVSPTEVLGREGRVSGLRLEKNELIPDGKGSVKAKGCGKFEEIPSGLVFRSVGYRGVPIAGVSFDEKAGKIPNAEGRVLDGGQKILPGEYVVGWAKRGPSGLIGTNRADSVATVKVMLDDAKAGTFLPPGNRSPDSIAALLKERGIRYVNFSDWKTIDRVEIENGKAKGKIRSKFSDVGEMLKAVDGAASAAR